MSLRIVHISDTHCLHEMVTVPKGDVLVHSGDISMYGHEREIEKFLDWFMLQPHTYKVLVPGNHDRSFDLRRNLGIKISWLSGLMDKFTRNADGMHFLLVNSGCTIENVKFWGSPHTPKITEGKPTDWAFMEERKELGAIWMNIPRDTDILVTHGPAWGKLDVAIDGAHYGCEYLRFHIKEKKPKAHLFGHMHEDYGMMFDSNTLYLNSSIVDKGLNPINDPQIIEIDSYTKETKYIWS